MNDYGSGLFGTTIDPYGANFGNPMNSANMNQGFGINSSLLTPSYQAPYRPHVALNAGYSPYGHPGFAQSVSNAFGPSQDPTWGNPHDAMQPSVQSMSTRPFDAMAWAGQNVALPFAAYTGMAKIMGPLTSPNWSAKAIFKGSAPLSSVWSGAGMGSRMGGGFGSGLARGMGMGEAGTEVLGTTGAMLGGLALPWIGGYVAMQTVNSLVFDQYTNSRRTANNLHNNFSNVYFGSGGDSVTGKGLSYRQSASMGNQIASLGANDRMFSQSDYSQIFDTSSRAGLFDNVKASGIVKRTKDIAEQIKLIVSISKDPDIQKAIEQLSSLNLAGASVTGGRTSVAAGAYQQLGGYAAQAGMSVQRLMAGVGAQGQYMFQANGMTPYLGQLAAANSVAGFSAAQRTGLLSSATLARSGGIEGATQGSLTAQMMAAQTPYGMMSSYNQFIGGAGGTAVGGRNQSVVNTIGSFGASVAGDPMSALGSMVLYGKAAAGADMARQGSLGAERQAMSILRETGVKGQGRDGVFSAEQIAAVMHHHMGIPMENVRDYILNRAAETDPGVRDQRMQALRGNSMEQIRQYVNQEHIGGGPIDSVMRYAAIKGSAAMTNAANNLVNPLTRGAGAAGEYINQASDWWGYGRSVTSNSASDPESVFGQTKGGKVSQFNMTSVNEAADKLVQGSSPFDMLDSASLRRGGVKDMLRHINSAAKAGNKDAQILVSSNSSKEQQRGALERLSQNFPELLGDYAGTLQMHGGRSDMDNSTLEQNYSNIEKTISALGGSRDSVDISTSKNFDKFSQGLAEATGRYDNLTQGLSSGYLIGAAMDAATKRKSLGGNQGLLDFIRSDKSGKYSSLLEEAGGSGATAKSLGEAVDRLQVGGLGAGVGTFSKAVFSGLTAEQISKMTPKERTAYEKKFMSDHGGNLLDMTQLSRKSLAGSTPDQIEGYKSDLDNNDKLVKDVNEQYLSGQKSYLDVREKYGKIDGNTTFAMAVDKFARNVDKMSDSGTTSKDPNETDWNPSHWFSPLKGKTNTTSPDSH